MCGIAGYIGKSTKPEVSYQIVTEVFRQLESRGTDAAGWWGTENGNDGKVFFHKEPNKSSLVIAKQPWQRMCEDLNMLLLHCRASSVGVGLSIINKNNHPFVSQDKTIALTHNGRIPDVEYKALSEKYEVKSSTDSEILLRIFEQNETLNADMEKHISPLVKNTQLDRLRGVRNIWSQIVKGHFAVAIGERLNDNGRRLWLFHNKHRPIWAIDLRKTLGQIFYCSTPEIWHMALQNCPEAKDYCSKTKLIEIPEDEIWCMTITNQQPVVVAENLHKFSVASKNFFTFNHQGEKLKIPKNTIDLAIVSKLNDDEMPQQESVSFVTEEEIDEEDVEIIKAIKGDQNTETMEEDTEDKPMSEEDVRQLQVKVLELEGCFEGLRFDVEQLDKTEHNLTRSDCEQIIDEIETLIDTYAGIKSLMQS